MEIACIILEAAKEESTKTKIMYKSFLNHIHLKEYLSELIENNLLEYSDGTKTYKTTKIGLNLLHLQANKEVGKLFQAHLE